MTGSLSTDHSFPVPSKLTLTSQTTYVVTCCCVRLQLMFVLAPPSTKKALVSHLMSDPAGSYLIRKYLGEPSGPETLLVACMVILLHLMAC